MEPIHQGWLVKSPPEHKSVGTWKLFGAKWRRRYFVLYGPPVVEGMHSDSSTAILEYYTSKKLHHKCGTIDLSKCEEVYSDLDCTMYKHVFCVQTTHKCRNRTYYLAAETEAEMTKWVDILCHILGLTESNETPAMFLPDIIEAKIQQILQPYTAARPVTQIPSKQQPNYATHPKPLSPELPPPRPMTLACTRAGSEPNLLEATSPNRSTNAFLRSGDDHWIGSPPSGNTSLRNAGSVPELDLHPSKRAVQQHDGPPPLPPERGKVHPQVGTEYDHPSSNHKAEEGQDLRDRFYDTPPSQSSKKDVIGGEDNFYNTPPSQHKLNEIVGGGEDSFYNTPPSHHKLDTSHGRSENQHAVQSIRDDSCYDVPPPGRKQGGKRPSEKFNKDDNVLGKSVSKEMSDELYNVPKSAMGKNDKAQKAQLPGDEWTHSAVGNTDELYNVPRGRDIIGKDGKKAHTQSDSANDGSEVYNVPRQPILGKENAVNKLEDFQSPAAADDFYNVPRELNNSKKGEKLAARGIKGEINAGLPGTRKLDQSPLADETYDVPPGKELSQNRPPVVKDRVGPKKSGSGQSVTSDEIYNVPPSRLHPSPRPSVELGDQTYDVPPPGGIHSSKQPRTVISKEMTDAQKTAVQSAGEDQTYDTPPKIPPVPAKRNPAAPPKPPRPEHGSLLVKPPASSGVVSDVKADIRGSICGFIVGETSLPKTETERPATAGSDNVEKDSVSELQSGTNKMRFQQKESFHSASGATPPCMAKKSTPTVEIRDSIRFTQRSKSFKRSLPSQQRSDLPLPIKRVIERSESSSDDDDCPSPTH